MTRDEVHPADPGLIARVDLLRRSGRMDEAVGLLRARTELAPRDVAAWAGLAETLATANRPDLAAEAWARALALSPNSIHLLCGRARSLQSLGHPGEAAACYEGALELDPEAFDPRFGLALLAYDAGDLDRAGGHVARLEAGHGDRPGLAWLSSRLAFARGDIELAGRIIDRLLIAPGLDAPQRAEALLLNAEILDRLGAYNRAFTAARDGKAIQRRLFANRAAGHESETAKLRRLKTWFQAAAPAPWRATPPPGPETVDAHVFLLGFPRSGTTLLEQALAGHPQVVALEEAPTLADHYQAFLKDDGGPERLACIDARDAESWRARYWQVVREHGAEPRGRVFLDKAPAGTANLPIIAKLFPRAKVLFSLRDPRDVVLSCFMSAFQMNALTYAFTDLAETAACYDAGMELAETYRRLLPLDLMEVRHETLIEDFRQGLEAVATFVGLRFDPNMTDVARTALGRVVRTPSAIQVRAGLNRRGVARRRAYNSELAPMRATLAPWVERFGYPIE